MNGANEVERRTAPLRADGAGGGEMVSVCCDGMVDVFICKGVEVESDKVEFEFKVPVVLVEVDVEMEGRVDLVAGTGVCLTRVMVLVLEEDERVRVEGIGIEEVASGSGLSNEPLIPRNLEKMSIVLHIWAFDLLEKRGPATIRKAIVQLKRQRGYGEITAEQCKSVKEHARILLARNPSLDLRWGLATTDKRPSSSANRNTHSEGHRSSFRDVNCGY